MSALGPRRTPDQCSRGACQNYYSNCGSTLSHQLTNRFLCTVYETLNLEVGVILKTKTNHDLQYIFYTFKSNRQYKELNWTCIVLGLHIWCIFAEETLLWKLLLFFIPSLDLFICIYNTHILIIKASKCIQFWADITVQIVM